MNAAALRGGLLGLALLALPDTVLAAGGLQFPVPAGFVDLKSAGAAPAGIPQEHLDKAPHFEAYGVKLKDGAVVGSFSAGVSNGPAPFGHFHEVIPIAPDTKFTTKTVQVQGVTSERIELELASGMNELLYVLPGDAQWGWIKLSADKAQYGELVAPVEATLQNIRGVSKGEQSAADKAAATTTVDNSSVRLAVIVTMAVVGGYVLLRVARRRGTTSSP